MSLFTIGEGFVIALAVRQSLPGDLYELADIEGAPAWYVFGRVTLPLMAPALLLLLFRDTIYSFQANFVPALLIFDGGPPPSPPRTCRCLCTRTRSSTCATATRPRRRSSCSRSRR
jgi:ABC-type sugar transport system permease subunit